MRRFSCFQEQRNYFVKPSQKNSYKETFKTGTVGLIFKEKSVKYVVSGRDMNFTTPGDFFYHRYDEDERGIYRGIAKDLQENTIIMLAFDLL